MLSKMLSEITAKCMLQLVHPSRVLKLRVRGTKKDLMQETSSEEIIIVLPGIIARFDGSNIQVKKIVLT